MPRLSNSLRVLALAPLVAQAGCSGIKTVDTPPVGINLPIPAEYLTNDVEKPELARFTLATLCGHLVQRMPSGLYKPLNIPVYPTGSAPKVVSAAENTANDYYSLIDNGGAANLSAAYGLGTASFAVSGEDRLETTIKPVASCQAQAVGKATIAAALAELAPYNVPRDAIYLITTANQEELVVNHLKSISTDDKAAVTPIINIGGNVYTKQSEVGRKDFIAVYAQQISAVVAASPGTILQGEAGSRGTDTLTNAVAASDVQQDTSRLQGLSEIQKDTVTGSSHGLLGGDDFLATRRNFLIHHAVMITK